MKVALLISGYLRSYDINLKFIEDEILNQFEHVDVYLHITKNESTEDRYVNSNNEEDSIRTFTNRLKPISTLIECNTNYHKDKGVNNLMNQWNKLYKLNELKQLHESLIGEKYDLVIRYRPDLTIKGTDIFRDFKKGIISIPIDSKLDKSKLTSPDDKYICDALAFGDSETMNSYFNIHNHIPRLVGLYGPISETILHNYLKWLDIKYELVDIDYGFTLSKCNIFAICGDSGSGKSTLSNLLQETFTDSFKLECDRYHKWERGNENWNNVTHLNPNANYITKMHEDIFNLKVGNEIYQVDYDHHTGKFTEKQLINPSNNLIICGLHSLYSGSSMTEDTMYNLKIYMDTDPNLKKKWKINRDVKERGYSVEKVLDSMKKRESDFNEFIDPQKANADLIVKFFTTDEIDFNDTESEVNLSLELKVNSKSNISDVLSSFNRFNIEYELSTEENFIRIKFMNYINIEGLISSEGIKTNSFYDYILYFIFNLNFTN